MRTMNDWRHQRARVGISDIEGPMAHVARLGTTYDVIYHMYRIVYGSGM